MPETTTWAGGTIVGREAELDSLRRFLRREAGPRALVLAGAPGFGKTKLWEAGVAAARDQGLRVLSARASDAEAQLSFAALIDLFDGVGSEELGALPAPQLEALEVALLRAAPTGPPPEAQAIAVGFLGALRALAAAAPLLVAIDDLQWLDPPSAAALSYAARRLDESAVGVLLAKRAGTSSPLEQALEAGGLEALHIGPLSLGATRRILVGRLGLTLPRHLLRRIFDSTLGNPLFALEVGRQLVDSGLPAIGDDLPVPDAVEDLLGTRVAGLPGEVRRLLLAVALSPKLRVGQLTALTDPETLDLAVEVGVLVVDGEQCPGLAPTPCRGCDSPCSSRRAPRAASRAGGRVLGGRAAHAPPRSRRFRTRCGPRRDRRRRGDERGGARGAAGGGRAGRARPAADAASWTTARDERLLELAGYLEVAGEKQRITKLLEPAVLSLPPGAARVRAYLLLTSGEIRGNDTIQAYLEQALAESGDDTSARASVLAAMTENVAAVRVERIAETETWALEALPATPGAEPRLERHALFGLAWTRSLQGRPIDDLCERFRAASPAPSYIAGSPERVAGQRLVWRGELEEARAALTRLLAAADERGEPSSYALQRLHVCELELRAGRWDAAERLLDEWEESADRELLHWPMYERCRALHAAGRGLVDEARRWGEEAKARAEATGVRWDQLEALRALGTAELLAREPERAAEHLRAVWTHTEREGIRDPGAFPVAPELVEALVELGDLGEALAVTHRIEELARQQEHPWGLATGRRCAALVQLGRAYDDDAVAMLERAGGEFARLGLAFDEARSLLSAGRAQRRARKWGAARETLDRAAGRFDELGSSGWAEAARAELSRVGARRPQGAGELTPTERRVAELAATGLANKEIAQELVVTVNTVEFHLSNTYAKLGIRGRAQLAGRLEPPE